MSSPRPLNSLKTMAADNAAKNAPPAATAPFNNTSSIGLSMPKPTATKTIEAKAMAIPHKIAPPKTMIEGIFDSIFIHQYYSMKT
jgi:hypothetical protein